MAELTPQEQAIKNRHPNLIFSDAFLNDPIKFTNDLRFDPESALKETTSLPLAPRDSANFVVLDLGKSDAQLYSTEMYSPKYNRTQFFEIIDTIIEGS